MSPSGPRCYFFHSTLSSPCRGASWRRACNIASAVLFQGILTSGFTHRIQSGSGHGGSLARCSFASLVPAMATLLAIPVLGRGPNGYRTRIPWRSSWFRNFPKSLTKAEILCLMASTWAAFMRCSTSDHRMDDEAVSLAASAAASRDSAGRYLRALSGYLDRSLWQEIVCRPIVMVLFAPAFVGVLRRPAS
ncbi:hypothetical protein J2857_005330 [Neorhizobium galegae]|nr:hypothetical protein [Neorhizobium galegae]